MRNDGKYLESDITEPELNKHVSVDFRYRRLYDSFSAQGHGLPAQPADYTGCYKGKSFYLECKTTGHKLGRLPKGSFSQLADMRSWAKCGKTGILLTHCYGFDGGLYLTNVLDMDPALKSWLIPPLSKSILTTELFKEIIKLL